MTRKLVRVTKFLLAVVTVFCVSWIVSVNEWHSRVHWRGRRVVPENPSTLRTIVAYSEEKQAELDRPSLITCNRLPAFPKVPYIVRILYFLTIFNYIKPIVYGKNNSQIQCLMLTIKFNRRSNIAA